MFDVTYNSRAISLVNIDGKKILLEHEYPSKPIKSPDGNMCLFISPQEWEELGSLYLVNLLTGEVENRIPPNSMSQIPKQAVWIDQDNIAVIIGDCYGTVNIGGNIYIYNVVQDVLKPFTYYKEEQVVNLSKKEKVLVFELLKYLDDSKIEYSSSMFEVEFEKLLSL